MSSHTSRDFEVELRELRAQTMAMGARCERIVQLAFDAYWKGAESMLAEVEELDGRIDQDELDIDALTLRILALRQPVAHDLRYLATTLKLVTDLERIGDEAVNMAERAAKGGAEICPPELRDMSLRVQEMLRGALESFVHRDVSRAEQILSQDDVVDDLYGRMVRSATAKIAGSTAKSAEEVERVLALVYVAKYLERIADHATNIAEQVIFLVRGDDVRHLRDVDRKG